MQINEVQRARGQGGMSEVTAQSGARLWFEVRQMPIRASCFILSSASTCYLIVWCVPRTVAKRPSMSQDPSKQADTEKGKIDQDVAGIATVPCPCLRGLTNL